MSELNWSELDGRDFEVLTIDNHDIAHNIKIGDCVKYKNPATSKSMGIFILKNGAQVAMMYDQLKLIEEKKHFAGLVDWGDPRIPDWVESVAMDKNGEVSIFNNTSAYFDDEEWFYSSRGGINPSEVIFTLNPAEVLEPWNECILERPNCSFTVIEGSPEGANINSIVITDCNPNTRTATITEPSPIPEIDLSGRWFQVYSEPGQATFNFRERGISGDRMLDIMTAENNKVKCRPEDDIHPHEIYKTACEVSYKTTKDGKPFVRFGVWVSSNSTEYRRGE